MTDRPWETEPTSLDFEADGLPCKMRRNAKWGTWCGYVGIGPEHPLYGLPFNHMLKLPASWFDGRKALQGVSPLDLFMHIISGAKSVDDPCPIRIALQVHGGCNYAEEADGRWWFGFDCGHAGDYLPYGDNVDKMLGEMVESMPKEARATMRRIVNGERHGAVYRDQQYVVSECQSLAAQLNAIVKVITKENTNGSPDRRGD